MTATADHSTPTATTAIDVGPRPRPARRTTRRFALGAIAAGVALAACGDDPATSSTTISVPADHATITAAVEAARPGDVIEVDAGTYAESVVVDVDGITIRGVDRNEVVLDGGDELVNGITVISDRVAVENLTIRGYTQNGLIFNGAAQQGYGATAAGVEGYRASYVTAHNNGLYGIYAFAARGGVIEHSYVSGHPDSGLYVGQCKPCDVVLRDNVAELNAIGYYGTNASGGVYVVDSTFRRNRLGLTPNSQDVEQLAPQEETVIAGNLVVDNDDPAAPAVPGGFFGGGIAVGGGTRNVVVRNRVEGHDGPGISLVSLNRYDPLDNRIEGNVLSGNDVDLWYGTEGDTTGLGNCFAGNAFERSVPVDIETLLPCGAPARGAVRGEYATPDAPPNVDHRSVPAPGPQPDMPASARSTVGGASVEPPPVDVDAIDVPAPIR